MGSLLSPVIVNIYLENFEQEALSSALLKPKMCLRYVDDTFVIWEHERDTLNEFLLHLNSIHQNIQFTTGIEEKEAISFLDVKVMRKSDGSFGLSVYRKPTHTDRYVYPWRFASPPCPT